MKKIILAAALVCGINLPARQASAQWAVFDAATLAEDITDLVQTLAQWNEIINTAHTSLQAFRDAYAGLKDWKHLGWVDTLQILQMPWLDGVEVANARYGAGTLLVSPQGRASTAANPGPPLPGQTGRDGMRGLGALAARLAAAGNQEGGGQGGA